MSELFCVEIFVNSEDEEDVEDDDEPADVVDIIPTESLCLFKSDLVSIPFNF